MEFEELKKVWDTQNNEPLYIFSEKALHNRILSKKRKTAHIATTTELFCISACAGAGVFLLVNQNDNAFMFAMAVWFLIVAVYLIVIGIRRRRKGRSFTRSVADDLEHAIAIASYQVRLSWLMRWNILPVGILTALASWEGEKALWFVVCVVIGFVVVSYAAGWEHNIYKVRKRELEVLRDKLKGEVSDDFSSEKV